MKLRNLFLGGFAAIALMAAAAGNNGYTKAVDGTFCDDITVRQGDSVLVPIYFKGGTPWMVVQADFHWDDVDGDGWGDCGLKPDSTILYTGSKRNPKWVALTRDPEGILDDAETWIVAYNTHIKTIEGVGGACDLRFMVYTISLTKMETGDKMRFLQMALRADKDAEPGVYTMTVDNQWIAGGYKDEDASIQSPATYCKINILPATPTAVDDVKAAKEVKSVRYYNMAGMVSDQPFDGVNIVEKTFTDGSRKTVKQILR